MGKKIILLIIVIGLMVGGGLYYFSIYHKAETVVTTVPTSTTTKVPTPTCNNSKGNCSGTNMIDCVKNWLVESGCFSQEYVNDHFSNFTISEYPGGHSQGEKMVSFIFSLDGPLGSNISTPEYPYYWWTYALVGEINGKYHIKDYTGPLQKYVLNISKEEAFQKIKNGGCYLKEGDTLDSIKLSVNDSFFYNGAKYTFTYSNQGLWIGIPHIMPDPPAQKDKPNCFVNAMDGELIKISNTDY